jgi:hypothetical protein
VVRLALKSCSCTFFRVKSFFMKSVAPSSWRKTSKQRGPRQLRGTLQDVATQTFASGALDNRMDQKRRQDILGPSTFSLLKETFGILCEVALGTLRACIQVLKLHFSCYVLLVKVWVPFLSIRACLLIFKVFGILLPFSRAN